MNLLRDPDEFFERLVVDVLQGLHLLIQLLLGQVRGHGRRLHHLLDHGRVLLHRADHFLHGVLVEGFHHLRRGLRVRRFPRGHVLGELLHVPVCGHLLRGILEFSLLVGRHLRDHAHLFFQRFRRHARELLLGHLDHLGVGRHGLHLVRTGFYRFVGQVGHGRVHFTNGIRVHVPHRRRLGLQLFRVGLAHGLHALAHRRRVGQGYGFLCRLKFC
mmetsp:Transcript_16963/g.48369  ORF Transcript_16963/g.48369 Transcript_16963/m.48369 type:complete len:215 (+) Transcript_16963:259-903(+)